MAPGASKPLSLFQQRDLSGVIDRMLNDAVEQNIERL